MPPITPKQMILLMDAASHDGWLSDQFKNSDAAIKLQYFGFLKIEPRYTPQESDKETAKAWQSARQALRDKNAAGLREISYRLDDIRRGRFAKNLKITEAGRKMLAPQEPAK